MSTERSVARKHHYVPQCYLRGFVRHPEKPRLAVLDMARRKMFETSPENVAAERDFHAINVEGHPPDALEQALSKFEGELAPAISRIVDAQSLTNDIDLNCVLNFIALLVVKNPRKRAQLIDFQADLWRKIAQLVSSDRKIWETTIKHAQAAGELRDISPVSYQAVRDFVTRGAYDVHVPTTQNLALELAAHDTVLRTLADRKWTLFRAPRESVGFITSDHPVCLMWSDPPRGALMPLGHGLAGTHVLFPLHKRLALLGSFEDTARTHDLSADGVARVNGAVIHHAHKQVYGPSLDFCYQLSASGKAKQGRNLLLDRFTLYTQGRPR